MTTDPNATEGDVTTCPECGGTIHPEYMCLACSDSGRRAYKPSNATPQPITSERCPKCGAAQSPRNNGGRYNVYECGSCCNHESDDEFGQSDKCRIAELTRERDELSNENEWLTDYAFGKKRSGSVVVNGKHVVSWGHDPVVGFVCGIRGEQTVYPSVMDGIRAAMKKQESDHE